MSDASAEPISKIYILYTQTRLYEIDHNIINLVKSSIIVM